MHTQIISIGEAARIVGRCVDTLRQWEAKGLVKPIRDTANRRVYSPEDIRLMRRLVNRGRTGAARG